MAKYTYNWDRFWSERGDGPGSLWDQGFLSDPRDKWGEYLANGVLQTKEIAEKQCLVLLGEPGIGKSRYLENSLNEFVADAAEQNVHFVNLRSCGSEARVMQKVFGNPELTGLGHWIYFIWRS